MPSSTVRDWIKWGERDPYFGVLSSEQFRAANIEKNLGEFFQSGERFVQGVIEKLEGAFGRFPHESALDFGCGVGRLTIPLAREFDRVVGVDVSPGMRLEASRNIEAAHLDNIKILPSIEAGQFDLVLSYIVLQHIPVKLGYQIIDQLLSTLKPRGAALLHVSLSRDMTLLRKLPYKARIYVPGAHRLFNFLQGRPTTDPKVQMNEYNLATVLKIFQANGIQDALVNLEQHAGGYLTACIGGRRA